jgi:hypothetical protein
MTIQRFRSIFFAASFVGALGFGATQAVALPQEDSVRRACDPVVCRRWCIGRGFLDGQCINGECWCNGGF